jgi:hypothetical protein
MAKIGKCPKCPAGSRDVLLIGGMCHGHFKGMDGAGVRDDAPSVLKEKVAKQKTLTAWYNEQIKLIPEKCENCGKKMGSLPVGMSKRAHVCHILPKSSIDSVKTHPLNRWFGCWQCHNDYDKRTAGDVARMKVVKLCRSRYKEFEAEIADGERKYVPEWLR